jgi:hypothetical protein
LMPRANRICACSDKVGVGAAGVFPKSIIRL